MSKHNRVRALFLETHFIRIVLLQLIAAIVVAISIKAGELNTEGDASAKTQALCWTSKGYKEKVKQLKYSPEQARALAIRAIENEGGDGTIGSHRILIGKYYLFSKKKEKMGCDINLFGRYVDGETGEVEKRGEGVLTEAEQQAMWGEKCRREYPFKTKK